MTSPDAKTSRRKRRWLQFRLRTMLIAVFLISLPLGWVARERQRMAKRHRAMERIQELGGYFTYKFVEYEALDGPSLDPFDDDKELKPIHPGSKMLRQIFGDDYFDPVITIYFPSSTNVDDEDSLFLISSPATNADMRFLQDFPELEGLHINFANNVTDAGLTSFVHLQSLKHLAMTGMGGISDSGWSNLAELKQLEILNFQNTKISNRSFRHIAGLKSLRELDLSSTRISDEALKHISSLSNLTDLNLRVTEVSDSGLEHLANMTNLHSLNLSSTKITDRGIAHLTRIPKLSFLILYGTAVTDRGIEQLSTIQTVAALQLRKTNVSDKCVKYLARMKSIELLDLRETQVRDGSVIELKKLPKLKYLYFNPGQISDATMKELQQALPNCTIDF